MNKYLATWLALVATLLVIATLAAHGNEHPARSVDDCPPGHVYIDYGETPQVGCMPEGVAREIGVWPKPEGQ